MIDDQSLRDIELLLNTFPGISSARASRDDQTDRVFIRFRCDSFESLWDLSGHATFANLGIELSPYLSPGSGVDERYFQIASVDDSAGSPSKSEILGIFLAGHLKNRGLLPDADADKLINHWSSPRTSDKEYLFFEWTGDLLKDCELWVEGWHAHCYRMGSFRAEFFPAGSPQHDPEAPFDEFEYWNCSVLLNDHLQIYHSDLGGNLILGGRQCRAICEAIIRVGLGRIED